MFCLFDDVQYDFEFLGQKKGYEHEYDYFGVCTEGRAIRVYFIDDEKDETISITDMSDISLNVPDYFLAYQRDDCMAVLTNVTFLELCDDCCFLETTINGYCKAYRIRGLKND